MHNGWRSPEIPKKNFQKIFAWQNCPLLLGGFRQAAPKARDVKAWGNAPGKKYYSHPSAESAK
jgi:hypothetical protein